MKRDPDLERKILFAIEDQYVPGNHQITLHIEGYDDATVYEHTKLLYQAGFVQSFKDVSYLSSLDFFVGNLSNAGYDYLETIRDNGIWNKTKKLAKEQGLPFVSETLKTVANSIAATLTSTAISSFIS